MSASEREPQSRQQATKPQALTPSALSMRDLLASCAAASAVSTPPRRQLLPEERETRRDAA
ncbi:hypothetical protein ACFO9E_01500 [Streptomyces maoxianensis]|uniref:Uncharacterized protein n=1 Tax=Streptomyces maoxianensis TaxID=1459942 RepID=A0ABV9G023_9ACTN